MNRKKLEGIITFMVGVVLLIALTPLGFEMSSHNQALYS